MVFRATKGLSEFRIFGKLDRKSAPKFRHNLLASLFLTLRSGDFYFYHKFGINIKYIYIDYFKI